MPGFTPRLARRTVLQGIGGAATVASFSRRGFAQAKAPVHLTFWTFDNPQQRPWVNKRIKMFMEQNPHVKVDFQWFAFGDLGKKISVGFATGTAPDGFVSQDWFMPVWLDKDLLAPLDVKKLGYDTFDAFTRRFCPGLRSRRHQGRQGLRLSDVVLWVPQLSEHQAVQGSRARCREGFAAELGPTRRSRQSADRSRTATSSSARASNSRCTRRSGR